MIVVERPLTYGIGRMLGPRDRQRSWLRTLTGTLALGALLLMTGGVLRAQDKGSAPPGQEATPRAAQAAAYNIVPGQWTWIGGARNQSGVYGSKGVAAPGNLPGSRAGAVSWTDRHGYLWLFGGDGYDAGHLAGFLNDLWKWNGASWTWISGSDHAMQKGVYGTPGVAAPGNVPGARHSAVSWTDRDGRLWLFGGWGLDEVGGAPGILNDLWKWNGTTWTWISGSFLIGDCGVYGAKGIAAPENVPGARHGAVSWTDRDGNFWLFGGWGYASCLVHPNLGLLNDLWMWNGTAWTWISGSDSDDHPGVYGTKGLAAPGNAPGARYYAVSGIDRDGRLLLFGGSGYAAGSGYTWGRLNDLWKWNGTNWTWVSGSNATDQQGVYGTKGMPALGNVPGARQHTVSWTDRDGSLWVFGGVGLDAERSGFLNDLWKWDGTSWSWVSGSNWVNQAGVYGSMGLAAPGNVPGARGAGVTGTDQDGNLWMFGGASGDAASVRFSDLWVYGLPDAADVAPSITSFTATPNPSVPGAAVSFSCTATGTPPPQSTVNFGDGAAPISGTGSVSGSHAYAAAGTYTTTCTASNGVGTPASSTMAVVVGVLIDDIVVRQCEPGPGGGSCPGSHTAEGGKALRAFAQVGGVDFLSSGFQVQWAFPGGTPATGTGQGAQTTYPVPAAGTTKTYTITATLTGPSGPPGTSLSRTITITAPPVACSAPAAPINLTIRPKSPASPGAPPTGTDTLVLGWQPGTGQAPTRYSYRVNGDPPLGTTATSVEVPPRGNADPVQLHVQAFACVPEQAGGTATSQTVSLGKPGAGFSMPASTAVNASVTLTDTSSPQATSWLWIYGDGKTAPTDTNQSQTHTFTSAGDFQVALLASNGSGTDLKVQTISVTAPAATTAPSAETSMRFDPVAEGRQALTPVRIGPRSASWLHLACRSNQSATVFLRFLDKQGDLKLERRLVVEPGQEAVYDLSAWGLRGTYRLETVSAEPIVAYVVERVQQRAEVIP